MTQTKTWPEIPKVELSSDDIAVEIIVVALRKKFLEMETKSFILLSRHLTCYDTTICKSPYK